MESEIQQLQDDFDQESTQNESQEFEDEEPQDFLSFDDILNSKIKLGKAQYLAYLTVGIVWICEGSELALNPLLNLALQQQSVWGISDNQKNMLTSCLFLGFFIGALQSGYFGDKYGRRKSLIAVLFLMPLFGVLSAFSWNVQILMFFRFIFGTFIGIAIPIAVSLQTEITPMTNRGAILVMTASFFVIGEIIVVIFAYYFLKDLDHAKWRQFIVSLQIFKVFGWFWTIKFFPESPRYLLYNGHYHEAIKIINQLIKTNNEKALQRLNEEEESENTHGIKENLITNHSDKLQLSKMEVTQLLEWCKLQKTVSEGEQQTVNPWLQILEPYYLSMTTRMSFLWFALTISFFGTIYSMTTILDKKYSADDLTTPEEKKIKEFTELFIATSIEFTSYIISAYLIDKPFMGRKKMMLIGFGSATLICAFVFMYQSMSEIFFTVLMSFLRFFFSMSFVTIQPYTTEVYPTAIRNKAFGLNTSSGRFAGILLLWILDIFFDISYFGPFLLFAILCALCIIIQISLPETLGKELDAVKVEKAELISTAKSIRLSLAKSITDSKV